MDYLNRLVANRIVELNNEEADLKESINRKNIMEKRIVEIQKEKEELKSKLKK